MNFVLYMRYSLTKERFQIITHGQPNTPPPLVSLDEFLNHIQCLGLVCDGEMIGFEKAIYIFVQKILGKNLEIDYDENILTLFEYYQENLVE